ncbi:MAG: hypothetical protein M1812_004355 [Candelaria pacifica]|nr:MAG: hypothetical protein M1812_004355 [Candelaria pacifica]
MPPNRDFHFSTIMSSPHNLRQHYYSTCGHIAAIPEPAFAAYVHNNPSTPLTPLICPDCMRSKITAIASENADHIHILLSMIDMYESGFFEIDRREQGNLVKSKEWTQANWGRMSACAEISKEVVRVMLEAEKVKVNMGYEPGWEGRMGNF